MAGLNASLRCDLYIRLGPSLPNSTRGNLLNDPDSRHHVSP
jgi:hypothetical protein